MGSGIFGPLERRFREGGRGGFLFLWGEGVVAVMIGKRKKGEEGWGGGGACFISFLGRRNISSAERGKL